MKRFTLPIFLALILIACAPSSANDKDPSANLTRSDAQGSVTIDITPLNLSSPDDQLEFNVVMNTHSADLSMDLATRAILSTNTGVTIQAATWEAPRGGHHLEGKLSFPTRKDGKSILEGVAKLTLTLTNVDSATRVYEWELK